MSRGTGLKRLLIGPFWILFALFVVIPVAVLIGVLYSIVEVSVLLMGRSKNAVPKWARPLWRTARSLWKWAWNNTNYIVHGTDTGGFQVTP